MFLLKVCRLFLKVKRYGLWLPGLVIMGVASVPVSHIGVGVVSVFIIYKKGGVASVSVSQIEGGLASVPECPSVGSLTSTCQV